MDAPKRIQRKKAARKAARTRAANRARWKRWVEVDQPALRRLDELLSYMLDGIHITLYWNPLGDTGRKLKNGAEYGELVKILHGGRTLRVLPHGYKRPHDFPLAFWELGS